MLSTLLVVGVISHLWHAARLVGIAHHSFYSVGLGAELLGLGAELLGLGAELLGLEAELLGLGAELLGLGADC